MKKIKRPCVCSSNPVFLKKGCPEEVYDSKTGEGCPKWREYHEVTPQGEKILRAADCIDMFVEKWLHEALKMNETSIQINESFRNGMCEEVDGKVYPKTSLGSLNLIDNFKKTSEQLLFLKSQNLIE